MRTPHDRLFHFAFREPRHAAAWLRTCLPPSLTAAIDWQSLRLCSELMHGLQLTFGFADLVFAARWLDADAGVFLDHDLLEPKLVRYAVYLGNGPRGKASDPPESVVTVVLYHGPGSLQPRPQPPLLPIEPAAATLVAALQPRLAYLTDEITACTEQELLARDLTPLGRLTLLCLRFLPGASAGATIAALDRWADLLRAVDLDDGPPIGREAIAEIGWYILRVAEAPAEDVHMMIEKHIQRPEETIMSTAERLTRQGEARTRIETLLRLLTRRFGPLPPDVEPRVRAGTPADFDRWFDRVLDAPNLAEVLAD